MRIFICNNSSTFKIINILSSKRIPIIDFNIMGFYKNKNCAQKKIINTILFVNEYWHIPTIDYSFTSFKRSHTGFLHSKAYCYWRT